MLAHTTLNGKVEFLIAPRGNVLQRGNNWECLVSIRNSSADDARASIIVICAMSLSMIDAVCSAGRRQEINGSINA